MHRENTTARAGGQAQPWFAFNAAWWPQIAEALSATGQPWPREAAAADLRWHADQARMGRLPRVPSYRRLSARWAWSEYQTRRLMVDEGCWACPIHEDSRTSRAPVAHFSRTSETIADVEPESAAHFSRTSRAEIATRARLTEEQTTQEQIIHASNVEAAAPPAEEPPAQPARTHGTPLRKLLSSDLVQILGAAGITEAEHLLDYDRDGLAEACRPRMSRGRLSAIDAALRRWTREQGEERGLRACEQRQAGPQGMSRHEAERLASSDWGAVDVAVRRWGFMRPPRPLDQHPAWLFGDSEAVHARVLAVLERAGLSWAAVCKASDYEAATMAKRFALAWPAGAEAVAA